LISEVTPTGHVFYILNDKFKICGKGEGKRTGMWIENKFYQTNKDGQIIVPFV
jgi:hypothetical protein